MTSTSRTQYFNTLSVECKKNIANVGAGTIGPRTARVCAQAGYSARLSNSQFAGVHFFNPVHTVELAEIVRGASTSERTIEVLKSFAANDSSGFIMNRVSVPFFLEPLKTVENGIVDFKTIDSLCRSNASPARRFESIDQGIGTILAVTSSVHHAFSHDSKFRPSRIQQKKLYTGHSGKKNGRGFYEDSGQ